MHWCYSTCNLCNGQLHVVMEWHPDYIDVFCQKISIIYRIFETRVGITLKEHPTQHIIGHLGDDDNNGKSIAETVDIKSRWTHNWKSAQVVYSHLVCDPTIRQPGFDLPRQQWSLLNRFCMEQGHCGACRRKWRLTDTDLCPCGETQTMSHIVESCPWQNWMAAYLGYILRMRTLFRGWPIMVKDTHTRRRRIAETGNSLSEMVTWPPADLRSLRRTCR